MDDLELSPSVVEPPSERDIARLLRAWFDVIIDGLSPDALALVREQCFGTDRTSAHVEIGATIDRRLAQKANPLLKKIS